MQTSLAKTQDGEDDEDNGYQGNDRSDDPNFIFLLLFGFFSGMKTNKD